MLTDISMELCAISETRLIAGIVRFNAIPPLINSQSNTQKRLITAKNAISCGKSALTLWQGAGLVIESTVVSSSTG